MDQLSAEQIWARDGSLERRGGYGLGAWRISPRWLSQTVFGTGFSHTARRAKDWTIAGTVGLGCSATLACSRRAIIASVHLRRAVAVSR